MSLKLISAIVAKSGHPIQSQAKQVYLTVVCKRGTLLTSVSPTDEER